MNRAELFEQLHETFTGKKGEKMNVLREYEDLPAEKGLEKAQKYLASSIKGQEECRSDWAYWGWEGDITLARVLIAIFQHMLRGRDEFPGIPNVEGQVLMDKQYELQQWAARLG